MCVLSGFGRGLLFGFDGGALITVRGQLVCKSLGAGGVRVRSLGSLGGVRFLSSMSQLALKSLGEEGVSFGAVGSVERVAL